MFAVNNSMKAISSKTNLEILKGILIEAKNGKLNITGNDLNLSISAYIDATIIEEGSLVVEAKTFSEIIKKLPDDNITFEKNDNYLNIRNKKIVFKIPSFNSTDYPQINEGDENIIFKIEDSIIKNLIKKTNFAVSNDETRPILTGTLIEAEQDNISFVSIDGFRLALKKANVLIDNNIKIVVPGKTLNEVLKIIESNTINPIEIHLSDRHITFKIGNITVVSKLLEGEFIKYSQIIPNEFKTKCITDTQEFTNVIERANLIARESKNPAVKLSIDSNGIKVNAYSQIGTYEDIIPCEFNGNKIEIGFNPKYIIEAMKVIESNKIILEFISNISPCIIRPEDEIDFLYLALPVRMTN
jgi:DNA polymerase-3 subunit beta